MNPMLNKVINRFLPITVSVAKGFEHEPKIADFEVIKPVGEGSFGRVYLARHKVTQMVYAIKEINKLDKNNQEGKPYFRREIEIMYKINHPNVVRLYSNFEDDKNCYFVLEYVNKGNLFDQESWQRYHCLTAFEVAKYMKDLISAVYYLHNMAPPIIHRDIKPENVLIDEHGRAKLTDFGWSNYVNSEVRSTYCGTPVYLAPEMIKEIGHDATLDIWCIGILMFELLTGNVPFRGKDFQSLNENILNLKIQWPKDINIDAKNLISKILRPDPKDRLSLVNMLKHQFFTKHLGHCDLLAQCLVKPAINETTPPFVLSRDVIKEEKEKVIQLKDDNDVNCINDQSIKEIETNEDDDNKKPIKGELVEEIQNEYEQLSLAYKILLISKNQFEKKLEEANQREFNIQKERTKLASEIEEKNKENSSLMKAISDLKQFLSLKDQQISILSSNILSTPSLTANSNNNNLSEEDYESLMKEKEQEHQSKTTDVDSKAVDSDTVDSHLANFHESIKKINETLSIQFDSSNPDEFAAYKVKMEAQLKMTKDYLEKEIETIRNETRKEKEQLTLLLKIKEEEINKLIAANNDLNKSRENEKIIEKYKSVLKSKESEIEVLKLKNKKMEMMYNSYMKKDKEKGKEQQDSKDKDKDITSNNK